MYTTLDNDSKDSEPVFFYYFGIIVFGSLFAVVLIRVMFCSSLYQAFVFYMDALLARVLVHEHPRLVAILAYVVSWFFPYF